MKEEGFEELLYVNTTSLLEDKDFADAIKGRMMTKLMAFGYEEGYVPTQRRLDTKEADEHDSDICKRCIPDVQKWFDENNDDGQHSVQKIYETKLRFCFTAGLGAAYFCKAQKEKVDEMGLYETMCEERGFFEMDEYIIDTIGINWNSLASSELERHGRHAHEMLFENYHLDYMKADDINFIGQVMFQYGVQVEAYRMQQQNMTTPANPDTIYMQDMWKTLKGKNFGKEDVIESINKIFKEGESKGYVVAMVKPDGCEHTDKKVVYENTWPKEHPATKAISYLTKSGHEFMGAYPHIQTRNRTIVYIDHIYEWENGESAVLEVRPVRFDDRTFYIFDTSYARNKWCYCKDRMYVFDISALGYEAEVKQLDDLLLEGQKAIDFNKHIGKETEKDVDGNPMPIHIGMNDAVVLFQKDDGCPFGEIQSPVSTEPEDARIAEEDFYTFNITLIRDSHNDDNKLEVPYFVRKDILEGEPKQGEPLRGVFWLQGHMLEVADFGGMRPMAKHTVKVQENGKDKVFTHQCEADVAGLKMTDKELQDFVKDIFEEVYSAKHDECHRANREQDGDPDFYTKWWHAVRVFHDKNYYTDGAYRKLDISRLLALHFMYGDSPVVAYVTLFDEEHKQCKKFVRGASYTAEITYYSVTTSKRNEFVACDLERSEFLERVARAFNTLSLTPIQQYLDKDVFYQSTFRNEVGLCKEDYVNMTRKIFHLNKHSKSGGAKASVVEDEETGGYIRLEYSPDIVDHLYLETNGRYITGIRIENQPQEN